MSKQVSLFSFFGNETQKVRVDSQKNKINNDKIVVRQLLNELVGNVVKELKRDEKKSTTDECMSTEKLDKWRKKIIFWDAPGGKVCAIFDERLFQFSFTLSSILHFFSIKIICSSYLLRRLKKEIVSLGWKLMK